MSKNKQVMSIAIVPELKENLTKYAKRKGLSASAYVGSLIEKATKLNIDDEIVMIGKPVDEDVKPVVLKIPMALRSDPEALRKWMNSQVDGIVNKLTKGN